MEDSTELSLHSIDYSSARWKHAECRQRAGIDDGLAVDQSRRARELHWAVGLPVRGDAKGGDAENLEFIGIAA